MPFKDTNEGSTHYYGDGCSPAHTPESECTRLIYSFQNQISYLKQNAREIARKDMAMEQTAILKKIDGHIRQIQNCSEADNQHINYALGLLDALLEKGNTK